MTAPSAQPSFQGRIGRTFAESEPWFEEHPHAPPGAPNVVFVLLDDTGFAQFGCFGSDIDTPHVDALAADGVQFTNFHVAPLCSPTRASLLTGRVQHAVGMWSVSNFQTGYPNQLGHIANHAATIAEVLRDEGYATFCTGKWHLVPTENSSAAGPFDQWPLGRGFDRFYGFLEGETDQFFPELVTDNHPIDPPARPEDGYHLSEFKFFNGLAESIDEVVERLDDLGGPNSHTNYPWGWAQCGNSPFRWYKQNTHEGGVHVPMVVHWPAGIAADQRGTKRSQFVNVSDVTPTVYELLGVTPPETYRGLDQLPVTGNSFASMLADPDAPATNTLQYFEHSGSRALVAFADCTVVESTVKVPEGDCELSMRRRRTDKVGGVVELAVDGQPAGSAELPYIMWMISSSGSSIGHDHGSTVSEHYDGSFPFAGTLHEVEINLSERTAADVAATARAEMARQ
ncbi:sulfatase-like hydrolase/transferase [Candidatus Poriferisodalis sp.]|uniref:sulfatase-like hydrolase/transferase n=1 Tax=Candidatus Poriferisodalis sp. TaxID=3101277 RepID=UPI003B5B6CBB